MDKPIRNNGPAALVASDLNGTLTTGSPVLAVYHWLRANQPDSPPPLFKYRILLSYLQVKAGLREIDTWGQQAMSAVLSFVREPDTQVLERLMDFVVERELWPARREKPISLLRKLHKEGGEIYLISAAYHPAVERFARYIAPERVYGIGTQVLLTEEGLCLSESFISRKKKLEALLEKIGSRELDVALGDTFADIPLLERAGKAIAVHPDKRLESRAKEENWEIIR